MPERVGSVLIIGATSAIAEAVARRFAASGAALLLAGRDSGRLDAIAGDLRVRGAKAVHTEILDVNRIDEHARFVEQVKRALSPIDAVLIAHGTLPDQQACQASVTQTMRELETNFLGTVS